MVGLVALFAVQWQALAARDTVLVPEITDLQREARLAATRQVPILVMFGADHCSYCHQLEEDFLKPMLRSGDYTDKVLIRQVQLDGYGSVRDFDGREISVDDLASRYDVRLTPTVVFVDQQGRRVAPNLVGLSTVDYYGGFLDDSIERSLRVLRGNGRS